MMRRASTVPVAVRNGVTSGSLISRRFTAVSRVRSSCTKTTCQREAHLRQRNVLTYVGCASESQILLRRSSALDSASYCIAHECRVVLRVARPNRRARAEHVMLMSRHFCRHLPYQLMKVANAVYVGSRSSDFAF